MIKHLFYALIIFSWLFSPALSRNLCAGEKTPTAQILTENLTARVLDGQRDTVRNLKIALGVLPKLRSQKFTAENFAVYIYPQNSATPDLTKITTQDKYRAADLFFWQVGENIFLDVRTLPKREEYGDYAVLLTTQWGDASPTIIKVDGVLTHRPEKTDVVLLVDISLSMRKNDPDKKRHSAVRAFANLAARDGRISRLGIIAFNENTKNLLELTELKNTEPIANAIKQIGTQGQTNIGRALLRAGEMLRGSERSAIILLTDGKNESVAYADEHLVLARQKIPVYTVGLSDQCDKKMLATIAQTTHGKSFWTANNQELTTIYLTLAAEIGQRAMLLRQNIREPQTVKIAVDETVKEICFLFDNPTAQWKITPPQKTDPAKDYSNDDFREQRFTNPAIGLWQVEIAHRGELTVTAQTDFYLDVFPPVKTPDGWVLGATLAENGRAILDSKIDLKNNDNNAPLVQLFDDGKHYDNQANDGIYANIFTFPPLTTLKLSSADAQHEIYQREILTAIDGEKLNNFTTAQRVIAQVKIPANPQPKVETPPIVIAPKLTIDQDEFDSGIQRGGEKFIITLKLSLETTQPLPLKITAEDATLLFDQRVKKLSAVKQQNLSLAFTPNEKLSAGDYRVPIKLNVGELSKTLTLNFQILPDSQPQHSELCGHELFLPLLGAKNNSEIAVHEFSPLPRTRELVALAYAHELHLTRTPIMISNAPPIAPPSNYHNLIILGFVVGGIVVLLLLRRLVDARWLRFAILSVILHLPIVGILASYFFAPAKIVEQDARLQLTAALVNLPEHLSAPTEFTTATLALEDQVLRVTETVSPTLNPTTNIVIPEVDTTPENVAREIEIARENNRLELPVEVAQLTPQKIAREKSPLMRDNAPIIETETISETAPPVIENNIIAPEAITAIAATPINPPSDEKKSLAFAPELLSVELPETKITRPAPTKNLNDTSEIFSTPTLTMSDEIFSTPRENNLNRAREMAATEIDEPQLPNAPVIAPINLPKITPANMARASTTPLLKSAPQIETLNIPSTENITAPDKIFTAEKTAHQEKVEFVLPTTSDLRFSSTASSVKATTSLIEPRLAKSPNDALEESLPPLRLVALPKTEIIASPLSASPSEKTPPRFIHQEILPTANTPTSRLKSDHAEFMLREKFPRESLTAEKTVLSRIGNHENPATVADHLIHLARVNFSLGMAGVASDQYTIRKMLQDHQIQPANVAITANELQHCSAVFIAEKEIFSEWELTQLRGYLQHGGKLWLHHCANFPQDFIDDEQVWISRGGERETILPQVLNHFANANLLPPTAPNIMPTRPLKMWQNFSGLAVNNLTWATEKWSNPAQISLTSDGDGGEALHLKMLGGQTTRTAISYVVPDTFGRRLNLQNITAQHVDIYNATKQEIIFSLALTNQTENGWDEFESSPQKLSSGWNRNIIIPLQNMKSRTNNNITPMMRGAENCAKITYYFHTANAGDLLIDNIRWE